MNKNNPFEGKAVKFDTAEQLEHLAELASGYGLKVKGNDFSLSAYRHFREYFTGGDYSNYRGANNLPEIHYYQFVADIDVQKFVDSRNPKSDTPHPDMVNHPSHYNVKGFEVIDIIDAFGLNFNMGNALKYLLRADRKGNKEQDIQKALWYLQREINTK
jgi:hypothetical protein